MEENELDPKDGKSKRTRRVRRGLRRKRQDSSQNIIEKYNGRDGLQRDRLQAAFHN